MRKIQQHTPCAFLKVAAQVLTSDLLNLFINAAERNDLFMEEKLSQNWRIENFAGGQLQLCTVKFVDQLIAVWQNEISCRKFMAVKY